jgi:hypothetical protein
MKIGDYFRRFAGGTQYSPSFPRGGLSAVFGVEIFFVDASASLTVGIEHKNIEDTSYSLLGSLASLTSSVNMLPLSGIKELVRFAYTVNGSNAYDTVYANILAPMWRPY